MDTIRVSAQSNPRSVAGCVAAFIRGHQEVTLQAVGAGAINQAVKAAAITREFLVLDGLDISLVPTFASVEIEGQPKTALRFVVETRRREAQNGAYSGVAAGPAAATR